MNYLDIIIPFVGGLGMFIYGMQIMAQGLENAAGSKMKSLLEVLTKNKLMGVLLGAGITAVIQSSSATTVMVVGFVNASIMNLTQAMGVIMGANIGTTVTGWLVSSVEWAEFLSPARLAPIAVMAGVILMLVGKRRSSKEIASIIVGFGLLFIGITTMSSAVEPLQNSESFTSLFVTLGKNPLLGILAGTLVTAIIQSSSASVGILQSLAAAGLVPFSAAIYIIMGQNIGTCVTAILSSIGANTNGKRTAIIHLMFNVIGAIIFLIVLLCWPAFYDQVLVGLFPDASTTQIAMFHTMFNVVTTLLLLPFSSFLVKLSKIIVKDKKGDSDELRCKFIDERFLHTPAIAVAQTIKEVGNTLRVSKQALDLSINSFTSRDYSKLDKFDDLKKQIKFYVNKTTKYLVDVSSEQLSYQDEKTIGSLYHALTDVERVTDLADNIKRYCKTTEEGGLVFSDSVVTGVNEMHDKLSEQFNAVITTFESRDKSKLPEIEKREDEVDEFKRELLDSHIKRLNNGECNIESSSVFINLVNNIERVGDHLAKIARSVAE